MVRSAKFVCPRLLLLLTVLPASSLHGRAQNRGLSRGPSAEPQTIEPPLAKNQIRVHANEVIAPVTVTDKKGELVLDLAQTDFHVFENGVEQTIDYWDLGGDSLAVALVIETSSHIQAMMPVIHSLGSIFTETVMALNGEAAVITYDATVDVRQPFTQDHDAVEKAISKVEFVAPEMKLYDAMAASVQLLKARPSTRRRIMLIVGESQDYSSEVKLGQVLRDAQLANITIYAVGPSSATADLRYGTLGLSGGNKLPPIKLAKHLPPISTQAPPRRIGAPRVCDESSESEVKSHLDKSRTAQRVLDHTKVTVRGCDVAWHWIVTGVEGDTVVWRVEARVVKEVESVGLKLQGKPFAQFRILAQGEIEPLLEWTTEDIPSSC